MVSDMKKLDLTTQLAAGVAVFFGLVVVFDQFAYWKNFADFNFGFLVPLLVLFILSERWPPIKARLSGEVDAFEKPAHLAAEGGHEVLAAIAFLVGAAMAVIGGVLVIDVDHLRWPGLLLAVTGLFAFGWSVRHLQMRREYHSRPFAIALLEWVAATGVFFSLLALVLGSVIMALQGRQNIASALIAMGFAGFVLGMAFLSIKRNQAGRTMNLWERIEFTGLFLFPALVWLISAPAVTYIYNDLKLDLLQWVTQIVEASFLFVDLSIVRMGNTLILPNGVRVGVADACSGVRSLTACLFAASFLGAAFLPLGFSKIWRKVLLFAVAAVAAFVGNVLRSVFLTAWAFNYGQDAINDDFLFMSVHDWAGWSVMGFTIIVLFLVLPIVNFTVRPPDEIDDEFYGNLAKQS